MASFMAVTASLLPAASKFPSTAGIRNCCSIAFVKAAACENSDMGFKTKEKANQTEKAITMRRDVIFAAAAAAAAACSLATVAMAEEEPKRGTEEAKKKYAPVCVTMPTARICRK